MRQVPSVVFSLLTLFSTALTLSLTACSDTPVSPGVDTGSLQVTVTGLPAATEANIQVTGPSDYKQNLKRSQTLVVPTGTYTFSVESVVVAGVTYAGELGVTSVDVARVQTSEVLVTYSSVGQVGPNEIAPGVTRTGSLAPEAFKDYTLRGVENVPLLFEFTGTSSSVNGGSYLAEVYRAGDMTTPLFSQVLPASTTGATLLVAFTPPATGDYLLRLRGGLGVVDYRVSAAYLSGSPEERANSTPLELGDTAQGAVTVNSFDRYRFTGMANTPVVLDFSYDRNRQEFQGVFTVEVLAAGGDEALFSRSYGTSSPAPEVAFTPQTDSDYEVRVLGMRGIVKYMFVFRGLE